MKVAFVSGAAGFTGCNLVEHLLEHRYLVYAIVRPGSVNNKRLVRLNGVTVVESDLTDILQFGEKKEQLNISDSERIFFHLGWQGERYDFSSQTTNIKMMLDAIETAVKLSCKRFIATGSQAEYGATKELITEDMMPNPFCDYGAAKVAACYLTRRRSEELGIEWIWGRIFSLYGKYEPKGRLIPDLIEKLIMGVDVHMSSCCQNWDYLDVSDAAEALIALAERGRSGEIYNIANGEYRPLKEFVEVIRTRFPSRSNVFFGNDPMPYVSLQPSVKKIVNDTGWKPLISFGEGIEIYRKS